MLLNQQAANLLNEATAASNTYPNFTHEQRDELTRLFREEAGRLLDRQAESTVKRAVELYCAGDISYEQYSAMIEQVSNEEAVRGATYGETSARNQAFDFAQRMLDRAKKRAHDLALAETKRQYELEKQKSEQNMKDLLEQYVTTLETLTQQQDSTLQTMTTQQKEELLAHQKSVIEQTKTEIEQIISTRLQEEQSRQVQEIHEQEESRPAREAARTAIEHVAQLERQALAHKRGQRALLGVGGALFFVLVLLLLFFALPQWSIVILLAVIAAIFVTAFLWKSAISAEQLAAKKRQIALFQTKSEEYAALGDEERCALLVQRVL